MKVLTIAGTNLRRLFRERSNIFFVIILPILLILLLGSVFGGGLTPVLGIVAEDTGQLGRELAAAIEGTEGLTTERYDDRDSLLTAVERGRVSAGVVIPAGYDQRVRAGEDVALPFYGRPDSNARHLRSSIVAAVARQNEVLRAARFAASEGVGPFEQVLPLAREAAQVTPGVTVESVRVGEAPVERTGAFEYGASTQLLLFVFLTSLTGGLALIETRTLGLSRRMLSTPTSIQTILAGEALGRFAVALLQGVLIMVGSALLFGVTWGNLTGAISVLLLFCLVGTGAAMLFASVLSNVQQAIGVALLLGLGMAAIGGSMAPLEIFPDTLRTIARITPHAWGNEAFTELIGRNGTVVDILPQLGVLALYAAVLLALSTWRLRKVLTQ
jgi:ABC-2 type transport system permease protein